MDSERFSIRSKIWIEDSKGKVAFGLGRLRILDAIERLGSMHAAAKELEMSYRAVWGRIRESEARMGRQLVIRDGKGSVLTPFARAMMQQFSILEKKVKTEADKRFQRVISDSMQ